jgi:hypothetical protein
LPGEDADPAPAADCECVRTDDGERRDDAQHSDDRGEGDGELPQREPWPRRALAANERERHEKGGAEGDDERAHHGKA